VKPAPFAYHRPSTIEGALAVLAGEADAKPLAGGQSLIPAMNFRLAAPAALVDLNGIAALAGITARDGGVVRIGAMTRHRGVEHSPLVAARAPLLTEAMPFIAHIQIRNRGTLGGSLAHADPAAELPAVMVALEATMVVQGIGGERRISAEQFFTGLFTTALLPGELLTAVEIASLPERCGWAFEEMARRHGDYALAGVAVQLTLGSAGECTGARVVLFSVGEGPIVVAGAEAALRGRQPGSEAIRAAMEAVALEIDPPADIHASAAYRRQLARVLTGRALARAFERARAR
jgi:carbon-monoxide dehydrogenase medium subunit